MLVLEQAQAIAAQQEVWNIQDDLCDCVFQRIGYWFNPYLGETLETRICCLYAEWEKQYPHLFRRTQAEPAEWNGESDMPRSLWHRQLSNHLGVPVSEARDLNLAPPKGKPFAEKVKFYLPVGSDEYAEFVLE